MLSFWNYSPVPQVTVPLLSEHSGSESAAFLGTAALGVFLPQGRWGQGGAWTPSVLPALRDGECGSWQDCGSASPGRDFKWPHCILLHLFLRICKVTHFNLGIKFFKYQLSRLKMTHNLCMFQIPDGG